MREMKKSRYLIAFFLSLCIFIIGVLIGVVISGERASYLEEINTIQRLGYDSLQLQSLYLTSALDVENNCLAALSTLDENVNNLVKAGGELTSFLEQVGMDENKVLLIKREYILAQIRYWLLAERVKEECDIDTVSILYFYSNEECADCSAQGLILTYLKHNLKDKLLVFSFDSDFSDEPMIGILKRTYNITKVPSLVIGETKYEGLIKRDNILDVICPFYKEEVDICEGHIIELNNFTNLTQDAM